MSVVIKRSPARSVNRKSEVQVVPNYLIAASPQHMAVSLRLTVTHIKNIQEAPPPPEA